MDTIQQISVSFRNWIAALAISYTLIEVFSFGAYFLLQGHPPSLVALRGLQHKVSQSIKLARGTQSPSAIYSPHPYLGYTYRRNTRVYDVLSFNTNAEGFPHVIAAGTDSDFSVAITGGSVALQLAVAGGHRLKNTLEKRLRKRNIRIVPLAVGGYAAPEQLFAVSYYYVKGGEIDVLVNLDGFNEVTRGQHTANPTDLYLLGQGTGDVDFAVLGQIALYRKWQLRATSLAMSCKYSYSVGVFWLMLNGLMERKLGSMWKDVSDMRQQGQLPDSRERQLKRVELWKRTSDVLDSLVRSRGGIYIEFIQPNLYVSTSKPLTEHEKYLSSMGYNSVPAKAWANTVNSGYASLRDAVKERPPTHRFILRDLTDFFSHEKRTVYSDNCCHFNKTGIDALVDAIASDVIRAVDSSESRS